MCGRRWKKCSTERDAKARRAPDLVDRDFGADRPDELWVGDISYIAVGAGWYYVAVVLDACSRKVVGWAMGDRRKAELAVSALSMALANRRYPKGVVHHSDQGSEYTSNAFRGLCAAAGVRMSMGSVGDAYDNAMCESFFATLERELVHRTRFENSGEARREIFSFIEGFYNRRRLHTAIRDFAPAEYERRLATKMAASRDRRNTGREIGN